MADRIFIRRGLKKDIPTGADDELLFCVDTNEMFIGSGGENVLIGGEGSSKLYSDANEEFITTGTMNILGTEYTKVRWAYKGVGSDGKFFDVDESGKWKCKLGYNHNQTFNSLSGTDIPMLLSARLVISDGIDAIKRYIGDIDENSNDCKWAVFTDVAFQSSCSYMSVMEIAFPASMIKEA